MKWTTEAKVGAFTLAGLILCAVVLAQLSHLVLFGKDGYPLEAVFHEVGGLSKAMWCGIPAWKSDGSMMSVYAGRTWRCG